MVQLDVHPALVFPSDAHQTCSGGYGFDHCQIRQQSFVEIVHEIFSMVILSLLLIQEGQFLLSGELMCLITGEPLRGVILSGKGGLVN